MEPLLFINEFEKIYYYITIFTNTVFNLKVEIKTYISL